MPLSKYFVGCSAPGCTRLAEFKMAARWSDGITEELKTYGLSCAKCLSELFRQAEIRRTKCRRAPGETIDAIGVYRLNRGMRDVKLERMVGIEQQIVQREQHV